MVPHSQPYSNFMAYLQNGAGVWTLVIVYTIIVIAVSSLLLIISGYVHRKKYFLIECVTDVVNLLLNDNAAIRYRNLYSADVFVILPLTFTGLIVMNGILSIFQSYVTSPIYQPQINSIEDLYKSSVPIVANDLDWRQHIIQWLDDISMHDGWMDRVHGMDLDQLSKDIYTFNNSIAFLIYERAAQMLLDVQNGLDFKAYHLLSDIFFSKYLQSFEMRQSFPYVEHVNDIIQRLLGAGLFDKWLDEYNERGERALLEMNRRRRIKIAKKSDTNEFPIPTVVWCGWIASALVFMCELIWDKAKLGRRCSHKQKGKSLRRLQLNRKLNLRTKFRPSKLTDDCIT